jgi:hypothetical protein
MVLAALLLWSSANLIGSVGQAADDTPAQAGDAETQAIADRLDAMLEQATARLGERPGGETDPGDANPGAAGPIGRRGRLAPRASRGAAERHRAGA